MKTPAELATDLYATVDEMEDDVMSILDFTYLLIGLTTARSYGRYQEAFGRRL